MPSCRNAMMPQSHSHGIPAYHAVIKGVFPKMDVLAVVNQKGGAGKTNVAVNLAAEFVARGLKTLYVDMDPQGTGREFVTSAAVRAELADVLLKRVPAAAAITAIPAWGLSLLGGTRQPLEDAEVSLKNDASLVFCLADTLGAIEAQFDRVLIDCRPSLGSLTQAAVTAATKLIIPVDGSEALDGLVEIEALMKRLERMSDVTLLGTIITKCNPRTRHYREVREALDDLRPFNSIIRPSVVASELHGNRLPARKYRPGSNTAEDYAKLATEVEARLSEERKT
jgi:chromosome partitioning protein